MDRFMAFYCPILLIIMQLLFICVPYFKYSKNPIIVSLRIVPIIVIISFFIISYTPRIVIKIFNWVGICSNTYFIYYSTMVIFPILIVILSYYFILNFAKRQTSKHLKLCLFAIFTVSHICLIYWWLTYFILSSWYLSDLDYDKDTPPNYKYCSSINGYFDYESASVGRFTYDSLDRIAFKSGKRIDLFMNSHNFSVYKLPDESILFDGTNKYLIDYKNELVYFVKENKKTLIKYNNVSAYSTENDKLTLDYIDKNGNWVLGNNAENIDVSNLIEKKEYIGDIYHANYTPKKTEKKSTR